MKILITGVAGFIGFHLAKQLLINGHTVIGIDNFNDYYDPALKLARINSLRKDYPDSFVFHPVNIADMNSLKAISSCHDFSHVYHLAAQAGVRYSHINPAAYIQSNMVGHANILELVRHKDGIEHFIYASSSSVYGDSATAPFHESAKTEEPKSLYAATKKADELLSRTYAHLYNIPTTGLRFFTVYGPWGRPDMAPWLFTEAILSGKPIKVFNKGDLRRDFTYIDDIVDGCIALMNKAPTVNEGVQNPPHAIYNIGNNKPVQLLDFITTIENILGIEAEKIMMPMQSGDVYETAADISALQELINFNPKTNIMEGMTAFINWYKDYHH